MVSAVLERTKRTSRVTLQGLGQVLSVSPRLWPPLSLAQNIAVRKQAGMFGGRECWSRMLTSLLMRGC